MEATSKMIDFKLLNFDKVTKKTRVWNQKLKNSINDGMVEVGQFIQAQIVQEIIKKSPSSGPVTRYGKAGKRIAFPAKKGKSPNYDTGALADSIDYKPKRRDLSVVVGSKNRKSCNYGGILQEQLNRPFVVPTAKKNAKKATKILLNSIKKGGFM
jgi:hypothetical protein